MKCIMKIISKLVAMIVFIAGVVVLVKLGISYFEKRGIVKTEWVIQKSSLGRGVRWVMSIKDKIVLSFQL